MQREEGADEKNNRKKVLMKANNGHVMTAENDAVCWAVTVDVVNNRPPTEETEAT